MPYKGCYERHPLPPCGEIINTNWFKKHSSTVYAELQGDPRKSFLVMSRSTPVAVLISPDEYIRLTQNHQEEVTL